MEVHGLGDSGRSAGSSVRSEAARGGGGSSYSIMLSDIVHGWHLGLQYGIPALDNAGGLWRSDNHKKVPVSFFSHLFVRSI